MSVWMEIRCENRSETSSYALRDGDIDQCWSNDNSGPMQMSANNNKSVVRTLIDLNRQAGEAGWIETECGWICPFCAKALGAT